MRLARFEFAADIRACELCTTVAELVKGHVVLSRVLGRLHPRRSFNVRNGRRPSVFGRFSLSLDRSTYPSLHRQGYLGVEGPGRGELSERVHVRAGDCFEGWFGE